MNEATKPTKPTKISNEKPTEITKEILELVEKDDNGMLYGPWTYPVEDKGDDPVFTLVDSNDITKRGILDMAVKKAGLDNIDALHPALRQELVVLIFLKSVIGWKSLKVKHLLVLLDDMKKWEKLYDYLNELGIPIDDLDAVIPFSIETRRELAPLLKSSLSKDNLSDFMFDIFAKYSKMYPILKEKELKNWLKSRSGSPKK